MKIGFRILAIALVAALGSALTAEAQQDILAVGTATGAKGATVTIPLMIRDASGTVLGVDQVLGNRIDGITVQISWAAGLGSVSSVVHSGIATGLGVLNPTEFTSGTATSVGYVALFDEAKGWIPFTLDNPTPQQIATITFDISASAPKGTFPLTINPDPNSTVLANQAGNLLEDTTSAGNNLLVLQNGSITITPVELTNFSAD